MYTERQTQKRNVDIHAHKKKHTHTPDTHEKHTHPDIHTKRNTHIHTPNTHKDKHTHTHT